MTAATPIEPPEIPARADDDPLACLPERLRRRLQVDDNGCWIWTGPMYPDGYGMIYVLGSGRGPDRRYTRAHRVVYETAVGPIPDGHVLDHLTDGPCKAHQPCCNPEHVEPVTQGDHMRREAARRGPRQRCGKGHDLTAPGATGYRRTCLACRRETAANRREAVA